MDGDGCYCNNNFSMINEYSEYKAYLHRLLCGGHVFLC